MKHTNLDQIKAQAQVIAAEPMSRRARRRERMLRLATLLERHEGPLRLLSQVEYMPPEQRKSARTENSPLTIAYRDPVLRGQGLASDRFGDAVMFFDLSASEAHHLFCDCHYGPTVNAQAVARRTRSMANRVTMRHLWDSMRALFRG
jgi:hypothetical protein